mmetsp:Transcript_30764/g.55723  ORF Transcript_30764/g.55723 Transcript_30764/m.55723 type:complete len:207 (-) Transcript_30764:3334-3954(-)
MVDATKFETGQHASFKSLEEDVVLLSHLNVGLFVWNRIAFFVHLPSIGIRRHIIDDSHTNDQLISIIIRHENIQVRAVFILDFLFNLLHFHLLVKEHRLIQFDSEYPRAQSTQVVVRCLTELVVVLDELTIFLDDSVSNVRIVIYFREFHDVTEHSVLQHRMHQFCYIGITTNFFLEIHSKTRCFRAFSNIDNFLQARHPKSNVLC